MLPNILVYIGMVFCTAWGHSASLARTIIFYAVVIVGAAAFLVPALGMTIDAAGLLSLLSNPKFGAGLFGAIVLSRLLCAPYWIWKHDQEKIASLSASNSERRRKKNEIINQIAFLSNEGDSINQTFVDKGDTELIKQQYKSFEDKTYAYLNANLGIAYAIQFKNAHGNGLMGMPIGRSLEGGG